MEDKRTPMEAEVQELPWKREPVCPEDFYGTAAKPRTRRSHNGLWICMSLILIAASTCSIAASILHLRLEKRDNGWEIVAVPPQTTEAAADPVENVEVTVADEYIVVSNGEPGSVQMRISTAGGDVLSPEAIYAQVSPAVVCVQVETYYGKSSYSGVVISEDGYILSATEGLTNAASVTVSFPDGAGFTASRVAEERSTGLCLLKVEASGLPTVAFAQDDALGIGQGIYCICNPYGTKIPNVFFDGMLAATGAVDVGDAAYTVLQTTAQLNNVGYGCPILDSRGLVVGLTSPVGKRILSGEDPCLAISAADLTRTIETFERSASSDACWLGLEVEEIPEDYQYLYGFPGSIWIAEIAVGAPPYGYLYEYDVVTAVDGVEVGSVAEFEKLLSVHAPGDRVQLTIFRSGNWYNIILPVMAR